MKDWHIEARSMRADGAKLNEIGARFGVTKQMASRACRGVVCPIDHKAISSAANLAKARAEGKCPGRKPVRQIKHGEFIRENYRKVSASHIGKRLGISRNAVIGAAYRMGLSRSPAPLPTEGE